MARADGGFVRRPTDELARSLYNSSHTGLLQRGTFPELKLCLIHVIVDILRQMSHNVFIFNETEREVCGSDTDGQALRTNGPGWRPSFATFGPLAARRFSTS